MTKLSGKAILVSGFCSPYQAIAPGFLQIQGHAGHPSYTISYLRVLCASFCAIAVKWTF
jgi:hypothetical protein